MARALCADGTAVPFAIDQWMQTLFWPDLPEKNDYPWAIERVRRCEDQVAVVARHLASVGIDAVLDLGFTDRLQRAAWLQRAREACVRCVLHVADAPAEVRWQRVQQRNEGSSATYTFAVTREMFDAMEAMWEPVTAEEAANFDGYQR